MKLVSVVTVGNIPYSIPTSRGSGESRADWEARHFSAVRAFLNANFPEGGWEKIVTTEVGQ